MAGQLAAILVVHWGGQGIGGFGAAWLRPLRWRSGSGYSRGCLFNKAKGREMVTGLIAGYFANGLYQLLVLFALGSLIPFHNPAMVLPQGYGLRNTVDLTSIQYADDLIRLRIPMQGIETRTGGLCRRRARLLSLHALLLPHEARPTVPRHGPGPARGGHRRDPRGAKPAHRDRARPCSPPGDSSCSSRTWGPETPTAPTSRSGCSPSPLSLVSGATVTRATVGQALLGTILFHTLFIVSPLAGKRSPATRRSGSTPGLRGLRGDHRGAGAARLAGGAEARES